MFKISKEQPTKEEERFLTSSTRAHPGEIEA
jgi:hypothetical protein